MLYLWRANPSPQNHWKDLSSELIADIQIQWFFYLSIYKNLQYVIIGLLEIN